ATILATQTSHIILVPSFNPSDDFVELLRDLSFLTGAVVVYVNSLHGDARVFIAGCAVGAVLDGGGATLLAKMEEHLDTMQAVRKAAPEDIDRARKSGDRHLAEQLRKRSTLYRDLTPVLKDLRSSLKDVIDRGGLDHIITVEF
ncbi:hypothetical protein, partial [Micromonospora sp. AMSO12t]|uniref:hypothetical protein n=1 Tax=Micromonospora sp. AMSO12t TaxID=2650410 RepID=UPI001788DBA4